MNFLALGIDDVPGIISRTVRFIESLLCQLFYPLIAQLYEVFRKMGLLFYNDDFSAIYKKISLVLGIYMVFRISFWLIELLVNPDKITDKEKNPSKIITRTILVVVMLAITPTIFKYAFRIQYEIVDKGVIEKIIVLNGTNTGDNTGRYLAANLFDNFYYINGKDDNEVKVNSQKCMNGDKSYESSYTNLLLTTGDLYMSSECLNASYNGVNADTGIKEKTYILHFDGFYASLVGGIVVWLLLMYCISVGTRYVQLIFLQVIAPIPIMCYVSPSKDNMFDKWVKQCVVTYLDLFIRVAIISFSMMLCQVVFSSNMLNIPSFSGSWIVKIFLVLGLLTFAKKAPDLIQELLPKSVTKASGDFGLSWKKRKDAMLGGKQIFGAASAIAKGVPIGLATGLVGAAGGRGWGRLSGFFGGVARGTVNGGKKGNAFKNLSASIQKQNQVNKRKIDWANSGSTWSGRMHQRLDNAFGLEGTAEGYENQINKNKDKINAIKRVAEAQNSIIEDTSNAKAEGKAKLEEKKEQAGIAGKFQTFNATYTAVANHMKNGDVASAKNELLAERNRINNFFEDRKNRDIAEVMADNELSDAEKSKKIQDIEKKCAKDKKAYESEYKSFELKKLDETLAKIDAGTYTAADAITDSNTVSDKMQENYVDSVFKKYTENGKIEGIKAHVEQIRNNFNDTIEYAKANGVDENYIESLEANAVKNAFDPTRTLDFAALNDMDGRSKTLKTKGSEPIIRDLQKSIDDIQASHEYQKAVADRNAVGGSSGKKS